MLGRDVDNRDLRVNESSCRSVRGGSRKNPSGLECGLDLLVGHSCTRMVLTQDSNRFSEALGKSIHTLRRRWKTSMKIMKKGVETACNEVLIDV